jgi:hopanoid biosynthesis associated RND transporter like protein HpnN
MKRLTDDSWMGRVLAWVAGAVFRHRRAILLAHAVLFAASIWYTCRFLEFDTNRDNLVGENEKYQHSFLAFKQEFPQQDDLAVVVESENTEKNRQFIERLGAKLEKQADLFTNLLYNNDLKMLGSKALLMVPDDSLVELRNQLRDYEPFIQKFSQTTNLVSFFDEVNTLFRTAPRETNAETESLVKALPALERIVSQADACLRRPGAPPSPGITALFDPSGEAQNDIYITYDKGRMYVLTIQPRNVEPRANPVETGKAQDDFNGQCIQRLRKLVAETKIEVPGVNVGVTGLSVLDYDEMEQSQKDTILASIVSLVLCALIFIYGYQETGRPVKATICLVVGLAYTLAFATLTIGHLNVLTITFVPMLVGLAIDYGVHLITRYEEELRHGRTEQAALTKAMVYTGQGIFTGSFTTAGAFLAMGLTHFKGIQEMGVICGGGLLICLIPMMTLLPVLLLRGRQNAIDHDYVDLAPGRARIERIWLDRPVLVLVLTVAACGIAATQFHKVYFDYNLLKMQSEGLPSVETDKKLVESAGQSLLSCAVIADSITQAVALEQQITNLPSVASVRSMAGFLNEDQTRKLRLIGLIKQDLSALRFLPPAPGPVGLSELSRTLYSLYGYCGAALDEIGTNEPALSGQFNALRAAIENFRRDMLWGSPAELGAHSRKLGEFQRALFDDLRTTFEALQNQDDRSPLQARDLPPALRNMFIGTTGKFQLMVFPKKDVWQRANQKEFIDELGTIDPDVTGMPVQLYHYTELLKDSYQQAAWYSLGAIVLLVLFHFRSVSAVVLALLPVAVGSVWLGGLMGALHIPFNPANIMTLPLVIGIGVTNGIHILNRFAEEQHASILARSTGKAVLVSGLTAIAGFGSLILAKHRGIQSLGEVMAIGMCTCMIAALTFLPPVLNLMLRYQAAKTKQPSAEKVKSTLGREEPR